MSPSLMLGDIVWVIPGLSIKRGDIVALTDPLDPERTVLRRALATSGKSVQFEDASMRIDGKRVRHQDMGELDSWSVYQETIWSKPPAVPTQWLIRRRQTPSVHWSAEAVAVPEDHWYLLADDRDQAIDSRWWGPVPAADIHGVVRARWGEPNRWRDRLAWLEGTD